MMSHKQVDYKEIYNMFLKMEGDLFLYDYAFDSISPWQRIRLAVFKEILRMIVGHDTDHDKKNISKASLLDKLKTVCTVAKDFIFHNPFFLKKRKYVFFGHPRRKLMGDGLYWDIYVDPIMEHIGDKEAISIESYHLLKHFSPTKTSPIYYEGFTMVVENFLKIFKPYKLPTELIEFSTKIESSIQKKFSVKVNVRKLLTNTLSKRHFRLGIYTKLLKKLKPECVIVVVGSGKWVHIEAAKMLNIPVLELQHGIIHKYHLDYSYPDNKSHCSSPDYYLTYGDYWSRIVNFPVSPNKVISIGFPFLEKYLAQNPKPKRRQLVFISQGAKSKKIIEFALQARRTLPPEIKIIYKLHPGETENWRVKYPTLFEAHKKNQIEVHDDESYNIYALLRDSEMIIGINSTSLFEGLAFNCKTYVISFPGFEIMEPLIDNKYVKLVNSPKDIDIDFIPKKSISSEYLFKNNSVKNFMNVISNVTGHNLN